MIRLPKFPTSLLLTLALSASPLLAQSAGNGESPPPAGEKPAPYDDQLSRLAEILGSVHYLRTLCGSPASDWRQFMQKLLDSDTASEPKRREKLTAAFNRGYRTFAAIHTSCTPAARTAEERYRNEGATLAAEIAARFGN
ncbi:TIGR02301 family protein [Rhizobium sp. LCM 4573]|uniref:TIGR02301 family protein n=1 Tax=Rhizobium sp. LCM 4573 TaxID=1848291 RepID=UPI0008D92BB4|nr:TIGR02301 family protein [Rhizobium sp. LCM 4573]OHV76236.1 TIGR02301 family protein [Rhizobium sp. LCM 4573]